MFSFLSKRRLVLSFRVPLVRNGLALVMIKYRQSHRIDITVELFCTVFTFGRLLPSQLAQKFSYSKKKQIRTRRTGSRLFKIHNPVVRIKCCAKIALKNRVWNYGKKSQWNFSMTEEICIHCKNEKVSFLQISERNMITCPTTCL